MRLVLINTISVWGGGELWTLNTAAALRERGHRVTVAAAENGELLDRAGAEGLETVPVPVSSWKRRLLVRELRRERPAPDVLLGFSGRDVRLASRIAAGRPRPRIVLSRQLDRPLGHGTLRRIGFRKLDLIVANSEATRRTMIRSLPWFPPEAVVRVYNAFDAEAFRRFPPRNVRGELDLPTDAILIGLFGRLSAQKGHEVMFRALPRILDRVPRAVLLVAGTGERETELRAMVRDLRIEGACRFTGHLDLVQPFIDAADLVVVPSRFEGFCFAAVEAQALGRPVVASRASSLVEVVRDGKSGRLVTAGDSDAFASAVIALAADPGERERMGREGRAYVKRFAPARIYDELEAVLRPAPADPSEAPSGGRPPSV